MRIALDEALKGRGLTSPNPVVGAVLVVGKNVIAKGHHRRAGGPHAEVACIQSFGARMPAGATLYVTLEPCSTTGRTGPCTKAIVEAGIKKVVFGAVDPNPKHEGRAQAILEHSGIHVASGVLSEECTLLNESYNKWIRTGQPFVIAKCGMSLDGRLTRPPKEARWLTNASSRRDAQVLRGQVDAILIGAETLRADDPQLTVRSAGQTHQPWRIVLTRSGKLPARARLFTDHWANRTLVYRNKRLKTLLRNLGRRKIQSVLIEGGGDILGQALDARAIDKMQIYLAPILTGGPVPAFASEGAASTRRALRLAQVQFERIGDDLRLTGYPQAVENVASNMRLLSRPVVL